MLLELLTSSSNMVANLSIFAMVAIALVISIAVHEFAHAYIATKLGDDTAKSLGRVTLNPLAHLDPWGTLLLFIAGFGWGKPVPFNPYNLSNPKRDAALISFAGPLSNILLAIFLSLLVHYMFPIGTFIGIALFIIIRLNIILAVFNLIPIHPLDGFKIVNGLLPHELSVQWVEMAPYGIWLLFIMILTGFTERFVAPVVGLFLAVLGF